MNNERKEYYVKEIKETKESLKKDIIEGATMALIAGLAALATLKLGDNIITEILTTPEAGAMTYLSFKYSALAMIGTGTLTLGAVQCVLDKIKEYGTKKNHMNDMMNELEKEDTPEKQGGKSL